MEATGYLQKAILSFSVPLTFSQAMTQAGLEREDWNEGIVQEGQV